MGAGPAQTTHSLLSPRRTKAQGGLISFLSLTGNHARTENDLPRPVLQVCRLQESDQEPGLLHGGGGALLRERWECGDTLTLSF